ncbi:unnamed protein product [Sphagnum troendelagicum]|uniref:Uncharacterized protein n=1 Tax=Sphagnum jensenii TaxID=128206 RepID=A0ABP0W426_9BRYO
MATTRKSSSSSSSRVCAERQETLAPPLLRTASGTVMGSSLRPPVLALRTSSGTPMGSSLMRPERRTDWKEQKKVR